MIYQNEVQSQDSADFLSRSEQSITKFGSSAAKRQSTYHKNVSFKSFTSVDVGFGKLRSTIAIDNKVYSLLRSHKIQDISLPFIHSSGFLNDKN